MTCIKTWMSSTFNQILSLTVELSALEHLNNNVKCFEHSSTSIFDSIFFILAGNKDNYKVSDELEIRLDPTMDCGVIKKIAALDQLKIFHLLENYSKYFDDLLALR